MEAEFLISRLNSSDQDKIDILKRVHFNAHNIDENLDYDTNIDKRKYSSLMHWMQQQLQKFDVDKMLNWINEVHQSILLDSISSEQEKRILKSLRSIDPSHYYFMNYYEMLVQYRHYLLIRMRYSEHARIDAFLNEYKFNFQRSRLVNDQMHQATVDIVGNTDSVSKSGIQWEKWMMECFEDESLDGFNRYMSLVRLTFIYSRYNMLDKLESLFDKANTLFKTGRYYSRRVLLNFYDNLVILYDKKEDNTRARYYGYLSIRDINPDSIIYINNLVNVLIKMKAYGEALEVLESINFKIRESQNFHSMVGFVSNFVRVLSKTNRTREAILKARVFLNAYDKQILKYRWYRFFSAFLGALLIDEKYSELLKLIDKYQLKQKEHEHYTPEKSGRLISIYHAIASLKRSKIEKKEFDRITSDYLKEDKAIKTLDAELLELIDDLRSS